MNIVSPDVGTALYHACRHENRWLMQLLLDNGADVNAEGNKRETPLAAILSRNGNISKDTMTRDIELLMKYGNPLRITTDDLRLAMTVRDDRIGKGIIERLLDHDRNVPVTEEIIAAATTSDSEDLIRILLERSKGVKITPAIFEIVKRPAHLRLFFRHPARCKISTEILEAWANKIGHGPGLIETALEEDHSILPTVSVVVDLLRSYRIQHTTYMIDLLKAVLGRNPSIKVTETRLNGAKHPQVLEFLLSEPRHFYHSEHA